MELPTGHTLLSQDERPIRELRDEGGSAWCVGKHGCTRIQAYDECGEQSMVPWLAIYHNDVLTVRVPARMLSVHY